MTNILSMTKKIKEGKALMKKKNLLVFRIKY